MNVTLNPLLLAGAGLLALAGPAAHANLLVNGSFETGPFAGSFVNLVGGSTAITGWTVTGTTIDYSGTVWQHADGARSLDLDGSQSPFSNGGVAQTFATTPGVLYEVRFDMAGNPVGGPVIKPMQVSAGGQSQVFTFDTTGRTLSNMGWLPQTWTFSAIAATTTLEFRSLTPSGQQGWGPALDNVRVTAVPEPGSWALMGFGLLAVAGRAWRQRTPS